MKNQLKCEHRWEHLATKKEPRHSYSSYFGLHKIYYVEKVILQCKACGELKEI